MNSSGPGRYGDDKLGAGSERSIPSAPGRMFKDRLPFLSHYCPEDKYKFQNIFSVELLYEIQYFSFDIFRIWKNPMNYSLKNSKFLLHSQCNHPL